jgi:hypothetical protein
MSGSDVSADLWRYAVWAIVALAGATVALIEAKAWGRYRLWILLVLAAIAGAVTTHVSPFTFSGGDHYMEGVIVMGGAGLALAGYAAAALIGLAGGRLLAGRTK